MSVLGGAQRGGIVSEREKGQAVLPGLAKSAMRRNQEKGPQDSMMVQGSMMGRNVTEEKDEVRRERKGGVMARGAKGGKGGFFGEKRTLDC